MGSWGTGILENDDSLDFIGGIYEEHKEEKGKDFFLFKVIKKNLKEISTSEFLEIEDSISVEVSAHIFSELINYDEKRINNSLKKLEEELEEECEGGYKLDLTKPIFKIIKEVEEKDGFISSEMYVDLCLYKNKDYNIGETFLYRLIRQLHNILSGNSENYELWEDSNEEDFGKWLKNNERSFIGLQKGLKNDNNIKKAINLNKMKKSFSRDGLKGFKFFNKDGKILKIILKSKKIKIEEFFLNSKLVKRKTYDFSCWGYFRIIKEENYKDNILISEKHKNYDTYDKDRKRIEKETKIEDEKKKIMRKKYNKDKKDKPFFNKLDIINYKLKGLDLNLLINVLIKDCLFSKEEFNKVIQTIEFIKNKNDLKILNYIKLKFNNFYLNRLMKLFVNIENYIKVEGKNYRIILDTKSYRSETEHFLNDNEKSELSEKEYFNN